MSFIQALRSFLLEIREHCLQRKRDVYNITKLKMSFGGGLIIKSDNPPVGRGAIIFGGQLIIAISCCPDMPNTRQVRDIVRVRIIKNCCVVLGYKLYLSILEYLSICLEVIFKKSSVLVSITHNILILSLGPVA